MSVRGDIESEVDKSLSGEIMGTPAVTTFRVPSGPGFAAKSLIVAAGSVVVSFDLFLTLMSAFEPMVGLTVGAATAAVTGASTIFGASNSYKGDIEAINSALSSVWGTDVQLGKKDVKEVVGGLSYVADDGEGGSFEVEYSADNEGSFIITHYLSDLGLEDFDTMMSAMSSEDVTIKTAWQNIVVTESRQPR